MTQLVHVSQLKPGNWIDTKPLYLDAQGRGVTVPFNGTSRCARINSITDLEDGRRNITLDNGATYYGVPAKLAVHQITTPMMHSLIIEIAYDLESGCAETVKDWFTDHAESMSAEYLYTLWNEIERPVVNYESSLHEELSQYFRFHDCFDADALIRAIVRRYVEDNIGSYFYESK